LSHCWKKLRFDEIAVLQRGHDLPASLQIPGEYPVVTSSGITATHNEFIARGPGVLTGRSGSVGRVHYIEQDYWPHNTTLYVIDFKGNLPRYIYYLLQFIDPAKVANSTGVPTLDRNNVHKLVVDHPPLDEQKRIVAILDEKLTAVEQARAAAQAQLQAAQALPAAYLRTVFESEEAQEWPLYELGQVAEIVGGIQKTPERSPRNFHRPFLTVKNVQRGFLDLSTVGRFEITENELERYRLYSGDILIVEGNGSLSHIGRNALFNGELDDCIHQNHIIRVRCQPDYLYPPYVSHYFNSANGQAQMIKNAETSSGLYTLSTGKIAALELPIPDINQQKLLIQELSTKMNSVNPILKAVSEQLTAIEALPAAFLHQAFTGEL